VALRDVKAPGMVFSDFREPANAAFEHEKKVTASINNIYAVAYSLKDFRTMQFLDWFVKEQGEEEKNTEDIVKRYDLFGNDARGLYLLDAELAARVYAPATLVI
jgi:ferritin